jgi:3',5'-cyclic AMP phosphodiesterase CpdA
MEYDALVISGDLTNVSHPSEFEYALEILAPILDERTFMIPGNHDRYQKKSITPIPLFEKYFLPWMGESISSEFYIYQKKIGKKTFLGWDSNRALSIAKANGYLDPKVIESSFKKLSGDYILVCHHPLWNPKGQVESEGHKFTNRREVVERLRENPPLLYLHGHTHSNWIKLAGEKIPFPIVNSASSTRVSDKKHDCGFHQIELSKELKFKRYTFKKNIFMETGPIFFKDEDGVV